MYAIPIIVSVILTLTSAAKEYGPASHYSTKSEYLLDVNFTDCFDPTDDDNIFKYSIQHLNKSEPDIVFSALKGKVLLLVNVATYCRSTIEFIQFNQLIDNFGNNLVIVAFPSNQFLNQEPADTAEEIYNGMKYVRPGRGFVPKFPLTKKIDVNGPTQSPIYSFLKRSCASTRTRYQPTEYLFYDPKNSRDIKWNFEKFLIHPQTGKPIRRYDQEYDPIDISPDIKQLLTLPTK